MLIQLALAVKNLAEYSKISPFSTAKSKIMPQTGTVLRNRYKIINILGSGGFGDTYLAEDLDLPHHPQCVVKHFQPKDLNPAVLPVAKRLFENEAEILYRLGNLHDQIPKLFAHFEERGEFYLVQEFINGHNLNAEIIPGRRFSEGEVIKLLQDILEVLAVVHQQNIIHRDIKPQNLMRRQDGKIVLIDFGAVKEIKGLAANTGGEVNSTIVIGTSGYMPNEQANRKPRLCSDVYAVGMIAIQALTGRTPQELPDDPSNGELIWRNWTNVSDEVANVLNNMVRYYFSQRYQSASEALQALQLAIQPPRKPSFIGMKIAGGVIATGCILGIGIQLWSSRQPTIVTHQSNSAAPKTQPVTLPSLPPLPSLPCGNEPVKLPSLVGKSPDKLLQDGSKYYGSVSRNNLTGQGILIYPDGSWYSGTFKTGKRNGCGTYSYEKSRKLNYYVGEFVDDNFYGLGKLAWKDNTRYIGEFQNNRCHGQGTLIYPNNEFQTGVWKEHILVGSDIKCVNKPGIANIK